MVGASAFFYIHGDFLRERGIIRSMPIVSGTGTYLKKGE